MDRSTHNARRMAAVLLAAIVVAASAPAAQAGGHGRYKDKHSRYRWESHNVRYQAPCATYTVRRSSAGPAIAGFLGGLFLGATLAHAAPDGYSYYDPYCHERFATLEIYRTHLHHHHHPNVVRVIELDNGEYAHRYHDQDGRWDDGNEGDWDDD